MMANSDFIPEFPGSDKELPQDGFLNQNESLESTLLNAPSTIQLIILGWTNGIERFLPELNYRQDLPVLAGLWPQLAK